MTLFDNIKKISKKRGYSIAEVERKAGVSTNYLYQWKTREPSPKLLSSVADVLGVSVDYLLDKEENPTKIRSMSVEESINSIQFYQGKSISNEQRQTIIGIVKAYLDSQTNDQ